MSAPAITPWIERNRHSLASLLDALALRLRQHAGEAAQVDWDLQREQAWPDALATLGTRFQLSCFELHVLALCAAMELDARFPELCAAMDAGTAGERVSAGLALAVLPHPHWSAFAPQAPLRRWRLIHVSGESSLIRAPMKIDERILHFLLGVESMDGKLAGLTTVVHPRWPLPPSHAPQVDMLHGLWQEAGAPPPVACLNAEDPRGARAVATRACAAMQWQALLVRAGDLPALPRDRATHARLLERECALGPAAIILDATGEVPADLGAWVDELACPLVLIGLVPDCQRQRVVLEVGRPVAAEQHALWEAALGERLPRETLMALAEHFVLDPAQIADASIAADIARAGGGAIADRVWTACREATRGGLAGLAERIESRVDWSDLVLPEAQCQVLWDMLRQVRHRTRVHEEWGYGARSRRGLGLSALFSGDSGTGKTLAAEVLANELGLDLYRIDLSAVVSKYIGETEKNLERVFRGAEASGAVLLFDEADALFGKRSDVKDSHDRYANIELAYLLQRMEAYRGLAILTTNLKSVLDPAFLRRIRFVVQFPFPDTHQRSEIWKRVFPPALPRDELRFNELARLGVSGGSIRNIALNAAFLAAEADRPLGMTHLAQAARMECAKIERPVSDSELGGWT